MSETILSQIIAAIVTIGVALIGYLKLKAGQERVEKNVDGMKTELVEAVRGKAKAEGLIEGVAKQKDESATTAAETVQAIKDSPDIDVTKK